MVTAFKPDEISNEQLLKAFFKQILVDPEISILIARRLAEKEGWERERERVISALCMQSSIHRKHWESLIANIK